MRATDTYTVGTVEGKDTIFSLLVHILQLAAMSPPPLAVPNSQAPATSASSSPSSSAKPSIGPEAIARERALVRHVPGLVLGASNEIHQFVSLVVSTKALETRFADYFQQNKDKDEACKKALAEIAATSSQLQAKMSELLESLQ